MSRILSAHYFFVFIYLKFVFFFLCRGVTDIYRSSGVLNIGTYHDETRKLVDTSCPYV